MRWLLPVRHNEDLDAHQTRQRETVPEHVAQDIAHLTVLPRGHAGHDDALGVDHLAHDAPGAVGAGEADACEGLGVVGRFAALNEEWRAVERQRQRVAFDRQGGFVPGFRL